MVPFRAALAAVLLAVLATPARAQDPFTCTGYLEKRVFLESQSGWWKATTATYGQAEHVHSGTCFPYLQAVAGKVTFDVITKAHNLAGARLKAVRVQAYSSAYGTKTLTTTAPNAVCSTTDCTVRTTVTADTTTLPNDGLTEFRIHSEYEGPAGNLWRSLATNGWPAYVTNGKPRVDNTGSVRNGIEGRGWYRRAAESANLGYENSRFITSPLPTSPVGGQWCPILRTLAGSGGEPIFRSFVSLDTAFHAMPENPGVVLREVPGVLAQGPVCVNTLTLANGAHKLFIRADASEGNGEQLSGAVVIPFTVAN